MLIKVVSLIIALCCIAEINAQCTNGFERYGNSCYFFVRSQLNWYNADKHCTTLNPESFKTHLASVETRDENLWLASRLRSISDLRDRDVWISGTSIDKQLGWTWASTYRRMTYTNWYNGAPTTSKCARMLSSYDYRWDGPSCDTNRYSSVCEYSLGVSGNVTVTNCPSGFFRFQDSCYRLVSASVNWYEAEQFCSFMVPNGYNVHLASIESSSEQVFIVNEIKRDSSMRNRDMWVGGNKIDTRKSWAWFGTNLPLSYRIWGYNEPSGSGPCFFLDTDDSYKWNDRSCTSAPFNGGFVCEVELRR